MSMLRVLCFGLRCGADILPGAVPDGLRAEVRLRSGRARPVVLEVPPDVLQRTAEVRLVDPPIVQFTSVGRKDSLRNVEQTREFVVCLAPEPLFEQINATGTDFPAGVSEFDAVGIEREPSLRVAPPRVARSPVALECKLHTTLTFGLGTVVMGRVVHAVVELVRANVRYWSTVAPVVRGELERWERRAALSQDQPGNRLAGDSEALRAETSVGRAAQD